MKLRPLTFIWLLGFACLSACSFFGDSNTSIDEDYLIDPIVLQLGATVSLGDDMSLTFDALKQDSRCPTGVECIWEGEVDAQFTVVDEAENTVIDFKGFPYPIHSNCEEENLLIRSFGAYKFVLTQVDPYPVHPVQDVDSSEIMATVRIFPKDERVVSCED